MWGCGLQAVLAALVRILARAIGQREVGLGGVGRIRGIGSALVATSLRSSRSTRNSYARCGSARCTRGRCGRCGGGSRSLLLLGLLLGRGLFGLGFGSLLHLGGLRLSLVRGLGGLRLGFLGSAGGLVREVLHLRGVLRSVLATTQELKRSSARGNQDGQQQELAEQAALLLLLLLLQALLLGLRQRLALRLVGGAGYLLVQLRSALAGILLCALGLLLRTLGCLLLGGL